jgi:hypothetical protein
VEQVNPAPASDEPDDEPEDEPDEEPEDVPDEDPEDVPDEEPDEVEPDDDVPDEEEPDDASPVSGVVPLELDEQPATMVLSASAQGAIATAYGKIEFIRMKWSPCS